MAIRLNINGLPIECDTVAEAVEIARKLGLPRNGEVALPRKRGRPLGSTNGKPAVDAREARRTKAARDFLKALGLAGSAGLTSEDVVSIMQLGGTRGVGGAMVTVRRLLGRRNIDFDDFVTKTGEPGNVVWKPTKRLKETLTDVLGGDGP